VWSEALVDESGSEVDLNDKVRQILRDFGHALSAAITDSSEASQALRRLREEGYSLYLLVREADSSQSIELRAASPQDREPMFRIDGRDLQFLRSIGIDPTRRLRRRRS
jgi:hypothetical protein